MISSSTAVTAPSAADTEKMGRWCRWSDKECRSGANQREWRRGKGQGKGEGGALDFDSPSGVVYISLDRSPADRLSSSIPAHALELSLGFFSEVMASLATYNNSAGKEIFLPYPPPRFDCDVVQRERRGSEVDEDWLPDLEDIFSGKYVTLIDLTGDSESEVCHYLPHNWHLRATLTSRGRAPSSPPATYHASQRQFSQNYLILFPGLLPSTGHLRGHTSRQRW